MVWLSLLITTIFLNLCNCSLTYRNRFWNNFLKTAVLFHAVSRERLCVCVFWSIFLKRMDQDGTSSSLILLTSYHKPVWHIPLLCVQWKTPDDGQRNCPKHVEFYSKNKFEKLVHLVDFIKRMSKILYECTMDTLTHITISAVWSCAYRSTIINTARRRERKVDL